MRLATLGATCALFGSVLAAGLYYLPATTGAAAQSADEKYPYPGEQFTRFVNGSFQNAGSGKADDFYAWFERAYQSGAFHYPAQPDLSLPELLEWKRKQLQAVAERGDRAEQEREWAAWIHRMVKKTIPRFSLDRGFEFRYVVQNGERQCFLQSVLISGLLQATGADAGVAMVYKNIQGQECNNGHAVCVLKLPDGTDILVDASEPEPFPEHRGLFLSLPGAGYRYLDPVYQQNHPVITAYRSGDGMQVVEPRRLRNLDVGFLTSQFDYYRGERAPGGLLSAEITPAGLAAETRFLKLSLQECPDNPLSAFTLGRTFRRLGRTADARAEFDHALRLYTRFGYLPAGLRTAMAAMKKTAGLQKSLADR